MRDSDLWVFFTRAEVESFDDEDPYHRRLIRQRVDGAALLTVLGRLTWDAADPSFSHARYATFQMAEVVVQRDLFRRVLANIADLRWREPSPC